MKKYLTYKEIKERKKKRTIISITVSGIFLLIFYVITCKMSAEKRYLLIKEGTESFYVVTDYNVSRNPHSHSYHTTIHGVYYDITTANFKSFRWIYNPQSFIERYFTYKLYGLKSGSDQPPFVGCVYRMRYIYDDKKDKMIDKIFYDEPLYDSIFVNDSLIYIAPPKEYYDIMNQERKNKNKVFRKK